MWYAGRVERIQRVRQRPVVIGVPPKIHIDQHSGGLGPSQLPKDGRVEKSVRRDNTVLDTLDARRTRDVRRRGFHAQQHDARTVARGGARNNPSRQRVGPLLDLLADVGDRE
jgi:hypothetical protein